MIVGTSDNVISLIQLLEQQKLQYVLAIWSESKIKDADNVSVFTSFQRDEVKKLCDVLCKAQVKPEENTKK